MAEPTRKRPRITPRNSAADAAIADTANITPFADLHRLGKVIQKPSTPVQYAPKANSTLDQAEKPPGTKTPTTANRTPTTRFTVRPLSARRGGPPTTPHAIRALQQRRNAGVTPGRDRRRSGRVQRETPRDELRKLASLLSKNAPIRQRDEPENVPPTRPRISAAVDEDDDVDDEAAPRLSMPLDDELDSWHEAPPRLSVPLDDDDDLTAKSIEAGRRALLDDLRKRSSRGLPDSSVLNNSEMLDEGNADGILGPEEETDAPAADEIYEDNVGLDDHVDDGGETGELQALMEDAERRRNARPSAIYERQASPGTDGEPTFFFRIPERRRETFAPPVDIEADVDGGIDEADGEEEELGAADQVDAAAEEEEEEGEEEEGFDEDAYEAPPPAFDAEESNPGTALVAEPSTQEPAKVATKPRPAKEKLISRHGIEYPGFPAAVVKRVASTFAKNFAGNGKLNKEALLALQKASDWFFEQAAEDLGAYASHAGRKTIEEADVITLMKRQRQLGANSTPFSLTHKFLPRELLQEIRIAPAAPNGKARDGKRKRMETILESVEE